MKKKTLITYWNTYYGKSQKFKESSFAKFVFNKIKRNKSKKRLIDIGCGNGRDSIFFSKKKIYVTGIDISKKIIEKNSLFANLNLKFIKFDVEKNKMNKKFDYIYCRFFLHAISENGENKLIELIKKIKTKGTIIFFEFRNHKDKIFGYKKNQKHNSIIEFEKGHYRRIINTKKFLKKIKEKLDCKLIYNKSSKNLSVVKNDNPNLTRLILKL